MDALTCLGRLPSVNNALLDIALANMKIVKINCNPPFMSDRTFKPSCLTVVCKRGSVEFTDTVRQPGVRKFVTACTGWCILFLTHLFHLMSFNYRTNLALCCSQYCTVRIDFTIFTIWALILTFSGLFVGLNSVIFYRYDDATIMLISHLQSLYMTSFKTMMYATKWRKLLTTLMSKIRAG